MRRCVPTVIKPGAYIGLYPIFNAVKFKGQTSDIIMDSCNGGQRQETVSGKTIKFSNVSGLGTGFKWSDKEVINQDIHFQGKTSLTFCYAWIA